MKKNETVLYILKGSTNKILLRMKLLMFFILVAAAVSATNSYSQQTFFNLELENVTVGEAFEYIESNSEFIFLYNEKYIDTKRKVNLHVKNETVETILDQVFEGTNNRYKIYDRQIVITEQKEKSPIKVSDETVQPQKKLVKGKVQDENGDPLPGVSIIVKGTQIGTSTNVEGSYELTVPVDAEILVVSFIGYKSQEIGISGKTLLDIVLIEDITDIGEVMVTGIRASQQRALSAKKNSVEFVDAIAAEDVGKLPDQNVAEALQRITGIAIQRSRGEGDFVSIRGLGPDFVRGTLNGRSIINATETFDAQLNGGVTSSTGRATNFDIFPSEIINTLEVSKSTSAKQVEGGIGGVVNVKTSRPLELGNKAFVSTKGTYREFAETFDPNVNGFISRVNKKKTFGFLAAVSYSNRSIREDFSRTFGLFDFAPGAPSDTDNDGKVDSRVNSFFPLSNNAESYEEDRDRITILNTLEWKPDENTSYTMDLSYSRRKINYTDQNFIYLPIPFVSDGLITQNPDGSLQVKDYVSNDVFFNIPSKLRPEATLDDQEGIDNVFSGGINFKKEINGWKLNADLSYSSANGNFDYRRVRIDANNAQDLNFTTLYDRDGFNIKQNSGDNLGDPSAYTVTFFESFVSENKDMEYAIQFDAEKEIDSEVLSSVETGLRFRTRDKNLGSGRLNTPYGGFNLTDIGESGYVRGNSNYLAGGWKSSFDYDQLIFPNIDGINNYASSNSSVNDPVYAKPTAGRSFSVLEQTFAAYSQINLKGEAAGVPFNGNVGFRLVATEQNVKGSRAKLSIQDLGRTNTTVPDFLVEGESVDVSSTDIFVNFLPSINLNFEVSPSLFVRMAASKSLTRPTFNQLNPAFSQINPSASNDINQDGIASDFVAGNPSLKPYTSTNADLGVEWYFGGTSAIYISAFYKQLDNYIASVSNELVTQIGGNDINLEAIFMDNNGTPTDPSDDPGTEVSRSIVPVDVLTQPDNQGVAQIGGIEFGLQQSFKSGLGYIANITAVKTSAEFNESREKIDFPGVSDFSYNLTGYYDKGKFEARLAYSYRDDYLLIPNGFGGQFFADGYGQLDASLSYDINDAISVTCNAINLTDQNQTLYVVPTVAGGAAGRQYLSKSVVGMRFNVGISMKF